MRSRAFFVRLAGLTVGGPKQKGRIKEDENLLWPNLSLHSSIKLLVEHFQRCTKYGKAQWTAYTARLHGDDS